jgi:hypothetical protein
VRIKRRARTALERLRDRLIIVARYERDLSSLFSFARSLLPLLVLSFFPSGVVGDVDFPRENHISTV